MNTPRKTFNYSSPYAKPVQQYPSQSEDYISLDMGGRTPQNNGASSSNEKTSGSNLKYYQPNYRNSNSKANRRNLLNNYGQQNNRQSFNQQRYRSSSSNDSPQQPQNIRNSNEKIHQEQQCQHNDKDNSIASYCHPSMTEDPWLALIQRIKSLEKSKLSTKDSSPPLELKPNSSSDNDQKVDSASSD